MHYDRRGYGATRFDEDAPAPGDDRLEAQDLERLRRHLDLEEMHLLGYFAGGPVAIEYTLRHSKRVRGLVLLSTYADDDERTEIAWPLRTAILGAVRRMSRNAVITRRPEQSGRFRRVASSSLGMSSPFRLKAP